MPIIQPDGTILAALPGVSVALNQTRTSPGASVPLGLSWARVEVNPIAWPAGSIVDMWIDLAQDGVTFVRECGATADLSKIDPAQLVTLGVVWPAANQSANLKIRANIHVLAGPGIVLAGQLKAG